MAEVIRMQRLGVTDLAYALHATEAMRSWKYFHEAYCVNLVFEGRAEFKYRTRFDDSVPEYVMVLEPGEVHYNTRVYVPGTFFAVFFDPARFEQILEPWGWSQRDHFRQFSIGDPELRHLMRCLHRASLQGDKWAQEENLIAVAYHLVRGAREEGRSRCTVATRLDVHKGLGVLVDAYRSSPSERVDIREVAARCGLSYHWFIHSFRQHVGVAPYLFIQMLRQSHTRNILARGPQPGLRSLADVAVACGYADAPHMSREFRSMQGLPPSVVAKQLNAHWGSRRRQF